METIQTTEPRVLDSLVNHKHGTAVAGMVIGPNKLAIICEEERREIAGIKRRFFRVQCQSCPNEFVAQASNLQLGLSKSCGCLRGRPLPASQRPHADKNYLRLTHLGLVYQGQEIVDDCEDFVKQVISDIGQRQHSDQVLVRLNQTEGWFTGNIAWSD